MGEIEMNLKRSLGNDAGSAIVEFSILAPVLVLIIGLTIDCASYYWMQSAMRNGAIVAARCSAIGRSDCKTATGVQNIAAASAFGFKVPASAFTVSIDTCGTRVGATYPYRSAFGTMSPFNGPINVSYCY